MRDWADLQMRLCIAAKRGVDTTQELHQEHGAIVTKPQIDARVMSIFQALLQEHGKDKVDWCERKASELRTRLTIEAMEGKRASPQ